jgi:hypothetical protein
VLDDAKHYIGDDEVEKLVRHGEGGSGHRARVHRAAVPGSAYLARVALGDRGRRGPRRDAPRHDEEEATAERPLRLDQRTGAILSLRAAHARP